MSGQLVRIYHSRLTPEAAAAVLGLPFPADEALAAVYFQFTNDRGFRFSPEIAAELLTYLKELASQSLDGRSAVAVVAGEG